MPTPDGGLRELTAGQLGIWYLQQFAPENPVYNVAEYLEIRGPLDAPRFVEAMRRAVGESDTFLTRIRLVAGEPRQYLDHAVEPNAGFLDLTGETDPAVVADRLMRADQAQPPDLGGGQLGNFLLIKLTEDRFYWYQRAHHIVADGYAGGRVAARTAEIYAALGTGDPVGDAHDSVTVLLDADRDYRASDEFADDRAYWRDVLADLPTPAGAESGRRLAGPAARHGRPERHRVGRAEGRRPSSRHQPRRPDDHRRGGVPAPDHR